MSMSFSQDETTSFFGSKKIVLLITIILSIVGMADAGYLTYEHFQGIVPPCADGFACDTVLSSEWASIGPVPISLLGFLFYVTMFLLSCFSFLKLEPAREVMKKLIKSDHPLAQLSNPDLAIALSTFGFLFSIFLVSIMAFVLKAWCQYCLISAFTSTSIWLMTLWGTSLEKYSSHSLRWAWNTLFGWKYRTFVKPILFLFSADTVHENALKLGETMGDSSVGRWLTRVCFGGKYQGQDFSINTINFPGRVGLAAGFDYKGMMSGVTSELGFGFHTIGSVTYEPNSGNATPQLGRYPKSQALWVNKGLKSDGVHAFITKFAHKKFSIPTGISIANTNKTFSTMTDRLRDILYSFYLCEQANLDHSYYELNISCPNTVHGEPFSEPANLKMLLECLERVLITKPVYLKMPIDKAEEHSLRILKTAADSPMISGVILGNLTKDRNNPAVNPEDRADWKTKTGNLSGKPTWERSNNLIKLTKKHFAQRFTIIGTGGVFSGEDALTKLSLGADLVQLITGMIFQGPQVINQCNAAIALAKKGAQS